MDQSISYVYAYALYESVSEHTFRQPLDVSYNGYNFQYSYFFIILFIKNYFSFKLNINNIYIFNQFSGDLFS